MNTLRSTPTPRAAATVHTVAANDAHARVGNAAAVKAILAGSAASLVGIGLARFAYTPLLPAMIHDQWFPASSVASLGAANLAGYLIGALSGRAMARYASPVMVMRLMMLLASVSFLACAFPLSEVWFFVWRLVSGVAGGAIMVLVSGVVLHHVPVERRGIASGAIFLGIGLGVVLSGTLVPLMQTYSLRAAWLSIGAVALLMTLATWAAWPAQDKADTPATLASLQRPRRLAAPVKRLLVQYGLMAVGLVPEMMFLVDYVSRGLHHGGGLGAGAWVAYGLGAMAGPLLYGMAADRFGARAAIRAALLGQVLAVLALTQAVQPALLLLIAAAIGSFPAGAVPLALARVHELVPEAHARQAMWSRATVAFALTQAVSGYAYSSLYGATGGHHLVLFAIGGVAFLVTFALDARGQDPRPLAAV
ncbi:Predicted arabinose efflux permease, MFS family [Roseateles sp. YR242]|uniref:YbfB/YjiJ family MFS transporter n=1 Tax=Roseateles sp. YR242 TaxID=1855305 RepID=UPI0008CF744F|nr:YbfB/YjiJ family MFS transporter [Roseateles sp. YR242]SEL70355.1 Predicted arabinose efflux permease, MFS family [Roseateles sp. YR242]